MKSFLHKYAIEPVPAGMDILYAGARQLYAEKGSEILDFERYGVFSYMTGRIAAIRNRLAKDPDNLVYAYLLYLAIKTENDPAIDALACPNRHLEDETYDLLPLFSVLYCIPDQEKNLRAKGVPEDVIRDTLCLYENQVQDFVDLYHRMGISVYVKWVIKYARCEIIRVGRFNLEMCAYDANYDIFESEGKPAALPENMIFHRNGQVLGSIGCEDARGSFTAGITETAEGYTGLRIENGRALPEKRLLEAKKWQRRITRGDRIINIHIPSGGRMDAQSCREDLRRGVEIIHRCFGKTSGCICQSWILDPQLKAIIGHESNLTRFADWFELLPVKSSGSEVFEYIFMVPEDTPLEMLPEKNRFSRAVKEYLLAGGHIRGAMGVLLQI